MFCCLAFRQRTNNNFLKNSRFWYRDFLLKNDDFRATNFNDSLKLVMCEVHISFKKFSLKSIAIYFLLHPRFLPVASSNTDLCLLFASILFPDKSYFFPRLRSHRSYANIPRSFLAIYHLQLHLPQNRRMAERILCLRSSFFFILAMEGRGGILFKNSRHVDPLIIPLSCSGITRGSLKNSKGRCTPNF